MLELIKIIGAVLGIVAFFWRVRDASLSYVSLGVEAGKKSGDLMSVRVSIQSNSPKKKIIQNAVLLVSPENENPIDSFNKILCNDASNNIFSTRGIAVNRLGSSVYGEDGRAIVPLPFFYKEHEPIGDEYISYRTHIDISNINREVPYSVRFYIWGAGQPHRSSQDSFIIDDEG